MPRKKTRIASVLAPVLLVPLQRASGRALRHQLCDYLRASARSGALPAGAALPSSRQFADDLGVSRGVVVNAYEQLIAEGYLIATARGSVRVAPTATMPTKEPMAPPASATSTAHTAHTARTGSMAPYVRIPTGHDFITAVPDTSLFPRSAWLVAQREAFRTLPDAELSYGDRQGSLLAREELAGYLTRARGVATRPEQLIICSGFAQGVRCICEARLAQGHSTLAIEDPTHPYERVFLAHTGIRLLPIPVDEEGIRVDALAASEARIVVVTPAHQFPLGVALSPARRAELIAWARDHNGLIIEDDYDAEFRYDRAPIGALQGLAPDHVIYMGSVSKTLAPALRLGWMAVPPHLVDELSWIKVFQDYGSPVLEQVAFAHMLATGAFDRHLRKARRLYRERRDALMQAVARFIPQARVRGIAAGLHCVIDLPAGVNEAEVIDRARELDVSVYGLSWFHAHPDAYAGPPALVLGYGPLRTPAVVAGIRLLGKAVRDCLLRA